MKIDHCKDNRDTGGRAWLVYDGPPHDERLHITVTSRSMGKRVTDEDLKAANCSVTISNLTHKEHDAVMSMINGQSYLLVKDGRLHAYHVHQALPEPIEDPVVAAHWSKSANGLVKYGGCPDGEGWHMPGIVISYLGAGIGECHFDRKDEAKRNIEAVEDCGFVCLRSKRLGEGLYDEQWVLHSLYSAKGRLKAFLDELKSSKDGKRMHWHSEAEAACEFLVKKVGIRFGTMDITIQRWALTCGD